jgi:hypothetical protein
MGTRYKEIRHQTNPRKGKGRGGETPNKKNPQTPSSAASETAAGPRRLSRAGEEYIAYLAEDRLRVQSEAEEKERSGGYAALPVSLAMGGVAVRDGMVGFSDLFQLGKGGEAGDSHGEEEEEYHLAPDADSSSSGEDGVVAPAISQEVKADVKLVK